MLKPYLSIITAIIISFFSFNTFAQTSLTADAGADQHVCVDIHTGLDTSQIGGMPSALGGIPPYHYSWEFTFTDAMGFITHASHFLNDTSLANPLINNYIYYNSSTDPQLPYLVLTVTDSIGAISKDSIIITFSSFGMSLGGPSTYYVEKGDSVFCHGNVVFGGIDTLYSTWNPNHGILSMENQGFWASPDTTTSYTLTVTDAVGCTTTGPENDVTVVVYPLGIEDVENTKVKIYPNPATDFLNIEREENSKDESLVIYDITGKEVFRTTLSSLTQTIDVSNLARGSYSLVIGEVTRKVVLR